MPSRFSRILSLVEEGDHSSGRDHGALFLPRSIYLGYILGLLSHHANLARKGGLMDTRCTERTDFSEHHDDSVGLVSQGPWKVELGAQVREERENLVLQHQAYVDFLGTRSPRPDARFEEL